MMDVSTHQGQDVIADSIRQAVLSQIVDAKVSVEGGGGHYTIAVVSKVFAGKNMLDSQRLVYRAIAHLMAGDSPPVHAVDSLVTRVP